MYGKYTSQRNICRYWKNSSHSATTDYQSNGTNQANSLQFISTTGAQCWNPKLNMGIRRSASEPGNSKRANTANACRANTISVRANTGNKQPWFVCCDLTAAAFRVEWQWDARPMNQANTSDNNWIKFNKKQGKNWLYKTLAIPNRLMKRKISCTRPVIFLYTSRCIWTV